VYNRKTKAALAGQIAPPFVFVKTKEGGHTRNNLCVFRIPKMNHTCIVKTKAELAGQIAPLLFFFCENERRLPIHGTLYLSLEILR
jgi:hypothetical protein